MSGTRGTHGFLWAQGIGRHQAVDHRGQGPHARGANGFVGVDAVPLGLYPRWDDIDERWDEERTYDEAIGPPDPHARTPYVDVWNEVPELEAVLIRVGAAQQAACKVRAQHITGFTRSRAPVAAWPPSARQYERGCRCVACETLWREANT